MKKKLLLILNSDEYLRNFLSVGSFDEIIKEYNCKFLFSNNIVNKNFIKKNLNYSFYEIKLDNLKNHFKIFDALMIKNIRLSKSFEFRFYRTIDPCFYLLKNDNFIKIFFEILKKIIKSTFVTLKLFLLKNSFINYHYIKRKINKIKINYDLTYKISQFNPDLVVFPSSGTDPYGMDISLACEKNNLKSFMIIDNWDNLSSKTIIWKQSSYLGVWGEQSKNHAINIQNYDEKLIYIIGSSRFDIYKTKKFKNHFNFEYLLILGTSLYFNEKKVIEVIDNIIEKYNFKIKILYRPHPWRISNKIIRENEFKNLIIDPQIKNNFLNQNDYRLNMPELDYYPGLIKNAKCIIGGATSMLIECLLLNKKYILLNHDEYFNLTSPKKVLQNYIHFEEIEKINLIEKCNQLEDLEKLLVNELNSKQKNLSIDLKRLNYYIYQDNINFSFRLKNTIDEILKC